jgi:hypothetical protein
VIEELEREPRLAYRPPRNRQDPDDEHIRTGTIIRIAAAVIVLGLGFTVLLPSIFTRDPVESTVTLTTSPAAAVPAQTAQSGATQPVPDSRPIPSPPAAATAPASNDATSVAKTAPALRGTNAAEVQADGRATGRALVPNGGTAAGRLALTAEEQAAVTRGLQALEKRPAVSAPRRPASTRPALTAEEQAAVERGLRELEKTAGQAKP